MQGERLKTRATSTSSGIRLQVSGELMDDYVFASDLTQASEISVIRTPGAANRLFYLGGSAVMSLFQDPDSDTGWTEEELGQPLNGLGKVRGAQIADGTVLAFGIGINQASPDLYVARKPSGGAWSGWQRIAVSDSVPDFTYAAAIDLVVANGSATLFALLRPTPGHGSGSRGLWRVDWQAADPVWTRIAHSDQMVMESCTVPGVGVGLLFANRNSGNPNLVDLFHLAAPFAGDPKPLSTGISYTDLAVGNSGGRSFVVIADNGRSSGSTAISVLDCAQLATGFVTVDRTLTATALVVTDEGATPMAIFALDERNRVNVIDRGGASGWLPPFNLQLVCASLAAGAGPQGQSELYAWIPGKGLYRKWRSPAIRGDAPGPGPWSEEPILYRAVNSRMVRQKTYATTIAVYDSNGAPMTNRDVNLRASQIVSVTAAGQIVLLGPDHDTILQTDAAGRIRLTAPASSLSTCEFSVSLPGIMAAEEDFKLQPNAKVQRRLAGLSEAQIKTLLNPKFSDSAAHVHQAIQAAMAPMKSVDGYRTVRHRPGGRHCHRTPIDTTGLEAFRFDVGPEGARFTPLTAAEADSARAELGVEGFFEFFEDVIDALGHAIETVVDIVGTFVVKPLVGAISIALDFVVDGIHYATEVLIDAVEQAFQAVDAVFDLVLTPFTALYDFFAWLLKDASADIWKTKAYFQDQLRSTVSQLATLAGQGAGLSGAFFATIETEVDRAFREVESKLSGVNLNTAIKAGPSARDLGGAGEIFEDVVDGLNAAASWLRDKVEQALFGASIPIELPESMATAFARLLTEMGEAVTQTVKDAIDGFTASLETLAGNSASFAGMALAGLLDAVRQAVLAVLKILDQLAQKALTLIHDNLGPATKLILGAPIASPLMAAVYDLLDPGTSEVATVEGTLCLLCAFPATILYRAITGERPFAGLAETSSVSDQTRTPDLIWSGLVAVFMWTGTDFAADADYGPPSKITLLSLVFVPALMNGLARPQTQIPPNGPVEKARFTGWILGFVSPLVVLIWAGSTKFKAGPRGPLSGQIILSIVAAATMGVNIWQIAVADDLHFVDYAILMGGPVSGLAKPLKTPGATNPACKGALLIADLLSGAALGCGRIKKGYG